MPHILRVAFVLTGLTWVLPACCAPPTSLAKGEGAQAVAVLRKPVSLEFVDTPLSDVVAYLREYAGVGILLESRGLEHVGLEDSEPITMEAKEIELALALELILSPLELDYQVRGDLILITDSEQTRNRLETRLYPVLDLVQGDTGDGKRAWFIDELIDVVQRSVDPGSWSDAGGSCTITFVPATGAFAIYASQPAHRRLSDLFEMIRASGRLTDSESKEVGIESRSRLYADLIEERSRREALRKEPLRSLTCEERREIALTETAEAQAARAKIELESAKLALEQSKQAEQQAK